MFEDRRDAGCRLAVRLEGYRRAGPVILGVPRGGVVVAYEVACALDAPLDVLVVRKLRAPGDPEVGVGALIAGVSPDVILNDGVCDLLGVSPEYVLEEVEAQLREARLREALLREGRRAVPLEDRTVIIVDDGIATGGTVRAAIRAVRRCYPRRVVLAVPVVPAEIRSLLEPLVDHLVCLRAPRRFDAVGAFYRDFDEVSDGEVITLVAGARARPTCAAQAVATR